MRLISHRTDKIHMPPSRRRLPLRLDEETDYSRRFAFVAVTVIALALGVWAWIAH